MRLIVSPDGTFNAGALEWLKTSASVDDVEDALEVINVSRSWEAAARRNAAEARRRA